MLLKREKVKKKKKKFPFGEEVFGERRTQEVGENIEKGKGNS